MGIVIPKTDRVVVRQADFAAYLALLRGSGDNPGSRIAYDGELLEIMSPSEDHERYKILFDQLIGLLAIEWGLIVEPTGSMTLTVEPRGAEPDSSYYVDNDEFKTNSLQLDLAREPAPDLVVEIDLSRERLDKRSIYASIGVTEFWRYDGKELRAFYLTKGRYEAIVASTLLEGLPISTMSEFLELRLTHSRNVLLESWQRWLRENRPAERL